MEDTDRDFFMSAADAVSYGLIDAIIDHPTNLAVSASESRCILQSLEFTEKNMFKTSACTRVDRIMKRSLIFNYEVLK